MSNWKKKAEENKKSAELLIKNNNNSSSVHCSYYSVIQIMLHILLSDLKKTEKAINDDSKGSSFHLWLSNTIQTELLIRNFNSSYPFGDHFAKLKRLRVKADYHNKLIKNSEAQRASQLSDSIRNILQNHFKV